MDTYATLCYFAHIRDETLAYITLKQEHRELGVKEYVFGVWGGDKSDRGAHRNSKAKSAFLMAEHKPESTITQITTIKKELYKAIQERMRLSQIYYSHNSSNVVPVPA